MRGDERKSRCRGLGKQRGVGGAGRGSGGEVGREGGGGGGRSERKR